MSSHRLDKLETPKNMILSYKITLKMYASLTEMWQKRQIGFTLLVNASVERLDGAFKDQSDEGGFRVARQNSRRQRQLERVAPSKDRCTYIISSSLDLLV